MNRVLFGLNHFWDGDHSPLVYYTGLGYHLFGYWYAFPPTLLLIICGSVKLVVTGVAVGLLKSLQSFHAASGPLLRAGDQQL